MLTTTILACKCPILLSPAMNTRMYTNSIVQENMEKLRRHGYTVIEPASGYLACGDTGAGKMPEPEMLLQAVLKEAAFEKDMKGLRILVTAGPTQESMDPVRYITNHSSGKMGYALAANAVRRGAEVTLVSGQTALEAPYGVKVIPVISAQDMYEAVTNCAKEQDIIIKAAAVADYRPASVAEDKIKKGDGDMSIALERTQDIIQTIGETKPDGQFLCGFCMETKNVLENARKKLEKKHLDMIVANNVKVEGAGFAGNTNVVTLVTKEEEKELGLLSKDETAKQILDEILRRREK